MLSVLYVDDEQDLLEIGKIFLEMSGEFKVEILPSAQEALASPLIQSCDAIISDYMMPVMDGIAFLKEVRARFGDLPFILFTGRGREEIVIAAINNGADFYLQKGGDPKAQFAELAHKVRQAVARRQAELLRIESEKRLADIINFLPDATFAIDRSGRVIAWNRTIEEMTGVPAADMIGRGEYEYAVPFYGERRKILIDLIFEPDELIAQQYGNVTRKKDTLIADTSLPRPRGRQVTLMGMASPLYDHGGQIIGAIESIRDITELKRREEELRAANEQLTAVGEELRSQYDDLARNERRIIGSEARLRYMLGFYEMAQRPEQELFSYAIEGAGVVTESPLGYLAFLNDDETELTMYAWSQEAMRMCSMQDKPIVYSVEKTGLWGEAVRQRRAVITNDYGAPNPRKKGYPEGHPQILRHMNVPVMDGDRIVMVAGVANRSTGYTDDEVRELTLLMQGLWQVIKRRRAEEELRAAHEQLTAADEELRGQLQELALSERRIRESEEKYETLVELSPDPIIVHREGRILYANPAALRMIGAERHDTVVGRDILSFIHPDNHAIAEEDFRLLSEEGKTVALHEEKLIRLNGDVRTAEVTATPIRYQQDRAVLVVFRDITDRRKAETELRLAYDQIAASDEELRGQFEALVAGEQRIRESEERYRKVIENSPYGMHFYELKPDGSLVFTGANPGADAILKVSHDRFIGKTIEEAFPGLAGTEIPMRYRAVAESGQTWQTDQVLYEAGAICGAYAITAFQVSPGSIAVMFVDITERLRAGEALRESEEKYRTLIEQSRDGFFILQDDRLVFYNRGAFTKMAGYDRDEMLGRPFLDFIAPEDRMRLVERIRQRGEDPSLAGPFEFSLLHKDGHTRVLVQSFASMGTYQGRPALMGSMLDITKDRLREAALKKSEVLTRRVLDQEPLPLCIVDNHGILTFRNDRFVQLFGYTEDDVPDLPAWWERACPDPGDRQEVIRTGEAAVRRAAEEQTDIRPAEYRVTCKDGKERIVEISGITLEDGILVTFIDLTERRKADVALRESEEKFRALVETTSDFIWEVDAGGRYTYVSPKARDFLGYPPEELIGKTPFDLMPPDEAARVAAEYQRLAALRLPITSLENRCVRRDGTVIILETSGVPRVAKDGTFAGYRGIDRDITARKRAEEALRESEARLQSILHGSPVLQFVIDSSHRVISWNGAIEEYSGIRAADIIGTDSQWRAFYPEKRPVLADLLVDGCTDGLYKWYGGKLQESRYVEGAYEAVDFFPRMGESGKWLAFTAAPIRNAEGKIIGAVETLEDITDRKRAEDALRQKTEELDQYFTVSLDLLCISDTDGYFRRLNPEWEKTLGYPLSELVGRRFSDLVHPDDLPATLSAIADLAGQKKVLNFTNRYRHRDGTYRWIEWRSYPKGSLIYSAARDITERKLAEQEIRQSRDMFRAFIDHSYDAVLIHDIDGRVLDVNATMLEMYHVTREEALSCTIDDLTGPASRTSIGQSREIWNKILSGKDQFFPWQARRPRDNSFFDVEVYLTRIDAGDQPVILSNIRDVTERKRSEAALLESEERYRNLFENNLAVMLLIDPETGSIVDANPAACTYYGWSHDELTAKRIDEINTLRPDEVKAEMDAARAGKRRQFLFRHRLADGTVRDVEVYSGPLRVKGRLLLYSIIIDVTERRRVEEELKASEANFRMITENMADQIIRMDRDRIVRYVSPSVERLMGYPPEEFIGADATDFIHPGDRERVIREIRTATDRHQPAVRIEFRYRNRGGRYLWFESETRILYDDAGGYAGAIFSAREITKRKRLEKSLQDSEKKYRYILERMQDAYFQTDAGGKIIMVSPSAVRLYRYASTEEMIGLPAVGLYRNPSEREELLRLLQEQGKVVDFSATGLRKDGTSFSASLNVQFRKDEAGRILGTEALVRDISERKMMESAVREANRKLNLLNSVTRHDVMNQLTVLQGYVQIALMDQRDLQIADILSKIDHSATTIRRQIEFTKAYQELGVRSPAWFRVGDVVRKVRTGIVSLSGSCGGFEIFADPMLEKVFDNLFDNAVRHGERVTEILVRCERTVSGLCIVVEDNGIGIPVPDKEKIFARGYGRHTGLGLFLAKEILAITGITIAENGTPGKGARFEIRVPEGSYRAVPGNTPAQQ